MNDHIPYTKEEQYNLNNSSPTEIFLLKEWDEQAFAYAQSIVTFLQGTFPQFKVHFIGSLALKLPGSNDIDMNVDCGDSSAEEIVEYAKQISFKYGEAIRVEPTIAQWVFSEDKISVDIILYNKQFEGADSQIVIHEKIKNSPKLQSEYKRIKLQANKQSEREYTRSKIHFFKKVNKVTNS